MGISYNTHDSNYTITAVDDVIKATVTDSGEVAADWINDILHIHRWRLDNLIVGLDVEWCPHVFHGTRGENPVALLQLCVGRRCLVFQLIYCDYIPDELCDFLVDDRFRFVGVGIGGDAELLESDYDLQVGTMVDLRNLAAVKMERPEMKRWGLQNLVREVMEEHMDKPRSVRLSNWGKRILSYNQIEYAAVDAFVSFEVGRRLYAGEF